MSKLVLSITEKRPSIFHDIWDKYNQNFLTFIKDKTKDDYFKQIQPYSSDKYAYDFYSYLYLSNNVEISLGKFQEVSIYNKCILITIRFLLSRDSSTLNKKELENYKKADKYILQYMDLSTYSIFKQSIYKVKLDNIAFLNSFNTEIKEPNYLQIYPTNV